MADTSGAQLVDGLLGGVDLVVEEGGR